MMVEDQTPAPSYLLASTATSAAQARRHLRRQVSHLPSAVVSNAEVCLSELVTNAVLHVGGPIRICVSVSATEAGTLLRLSVGDSSPVQPQW
ncbi:ATP-binding protein, partial [Kineococcus glutinatus]|uniref:ATP-binding protein n=1 Tax=Kineococcus glutinatus TaxID=1070872 RepID=UPI0031EC0D68